MILGRFEPYGSARSDGLDRIGTGPIMVEEGSGMRRMAEVFNGWRYFLLYIDDDDHLLDILIFLSLTFDIYIFFVFSTKMT